MCPTLVYIAMRPHGDAHEWRKQNGFKYFSVQDLKHPIMSFVYKRHALAVVQRGQCIEVHFHNGLMSGVSGDAWRGYWCVEAPSVELLQGNSVSL